MSSIPLHTFRQKERLRLSQRNSMLITYNLSGIWSEALIGRRSSYFFTYCLRMTEKRPQRSNVNVMNLLQNSQYSYNIFFFKKSIWVLLELALKRSQNFTIIDQEKHYIKQIYIWNHMTTGHWFISSVWSFCRWVPGGEVQGETDVFMFFRGVLWCLSHAGQELFNADWLRHRAFFLNYAALRTWLLDADWL